MKQLYTYSAGASREVNNLFTASSITGAVLASGADEAYGIVMQECHKNFPQTSGYYQHGAAIAMIQHEAVILAAANILQQRNDEQQA